MQIIMQNYFYSELTYESDHSNNKPGKCKIFRSRHRDARRGAWHSAGTACNAWSQL